MPPTTTVRTTGVPPTLSVDGITAVDAQAVPANVTAMTPRLASKAPNLLKFLVMPMNGPLLGMRSRIAAVLTVRRYGGTTASRIGSDYPDLCRCSLVFGPCRAGQPEPCRG